MSSWQPPTLCIFPSSAFQQLLPIMVSFQPSVECPDGFPMHIVDTIVDYMQQQYRSLLHPSDPPDFIIPSTQIPLAMVCKADQISHMLVEARQNPCMYYWPSSHSILMTFMLGPPLVLWHNCRSTIYLQVHRQNQGGDFRNYRGSIKRISHATKPDNPNRW